jgi:tripartite-type tricarboxylate transporter receptor subunit TctC
MNRRTFLQGAAAIGLGVCTSEPVLAQSFPSNVIRTVVPASVSTPPDILARIVANALTEGEGWKTVVEDKPGALMTIGAAAVLKQPADGHTLLSASTPIVATPALMPASFNIDTDFAPVIQVGTGYNALVVNPRLPVRSVPELIAYLMKDPGKHTFSSGGFGTPAHLLGELFKLETGVQATHVPYPNQFPQAIADLVSGVNSYQFITVLPVMQLINTGQLRALAVMGPKRIPALKDVSTIVESGYPTLLAEDWNGLLVRSGTPPAVIARLNAAINKALGTEKVRDSFAKIGTDVGGGTPEEFGALVRAEAARWAKVIKDAGIKIDS